MSDVMRVVERMQDLGFELVPEPPIIRVWYRSDDQPPQETKRLLAELRQHKDDVLAALLTWNEERERKRLEETIIWADRQVAAKPWAWAECWEWCRKSRPDLAAEMDFFLGVLSPLDGAFALEDVSLLTIAIRRFRDCVGACVAAYDGRSADVAEHMLRPVAEG